ncbi:MAG: hypothetical protein ACE5OY_06920 [Candidatus Bathyarchaeia archaeon]
MGEGTVSFQDFMKLDLRIGRIAKVEQVPKAMSLFRMEVDLGGGVTKQSLAGLVGHYSIDELVGRKIVFLANLEPKRMMGYVSEGMLLAAEFDNKVVLVTPDRDVPEGAKVR